MEKTKILLISGDDDFSVTCFQENHGGTLVKDIIKNPKKFKSKDEEWHLEVLEFNSIDPKFVEFIKSRIQDYNDSKNINFFLETDTI